MARLTVLFLILSTLAPLTAAAPPSQGENPITGHFAPLLNLLDWAFSWFVPTTDNPETDKSSPFIVPTGESESPPPTESIVPHGAAEPSLEMENSSPFIVPSG